MCVEVPELMHRSPMEARQRWLHLTGRSRLPSEHATGAPDLDRFYVQPPLLEAWTEHEDGSFEGLLTGWRGLADGSTVRTNAVELPGDCASSNRTICLSPIASPALILS